MLSARAYENHQPITFLPRPQAEWPQAAWVFRSTLLFRSFAIDHLTWSHWLISNALVYAAKDHLPAAHALRRFVKP